MRNLILHYADPHHISITSRYTKTVLSDLRFIIFSIDIKSSSIFIDNYSSDTVHLLPNIGGFREGAVASPPPSRKLFRFFQAKPNEFALTPIASKSDFYLKSPRPLFKNPRSVTASNVERNKTILLENLRYIFN